MMMMIYCYLEWADRNKIVTYDMNNNNKNIKGINTKYYLQRKDILFFGGMYILMMICIHGEPLNTLLFT